jgi:hypothetical protein
VEAEKAALDRGVGSQYPAAAGVAELKYEASRFVKAFLDIDISARACVPTVGSVAGSFGSFIACTQCTPGKNKVLFIDPGFPIQKSQLRVIGAEWVEFDIYNYRGEALRGKLEQMMAAGDIAAIVYSNPNNPAWICLEEEELRIIGELASNTLIVGPKHLLPVESCTARELNLMVPPELWPAELFVRVRYHQSPVPADVSIEDYGNGPQMIIRFHSPQQPPAPGQTAAVYDAEGFVLAGGVLI